jgi:hypothetical protein
MSTGVAWGTGFKQVECLVIVIEIQGGQDQLEYLQLFIFMLESENMVSGI